MRLESGKVDSQGQIRYVEVLTYNFVYYIVELFNLSHIY